MLGGCAAAHGGEGWLAPRWVLCEEVEGEPPLQPSGAVGLVWVSEAGPVQNGQCSPRGPSSPLRVCNGCCPIPKSWHPGLRAHPG